MTRYCCAVWLICFLVISPLTAAADSLPIRRVMLYKHGVGYFERAGSTAGHSQITLEFKPSEMNDVLKSLTLLDATGGRVSGVSYESSDPISKQLENFAFSVPKEASPGQVLDQFKGAVLIVKTQGGEMRGKILGVRRQMRDREIEVATLLLDGGEIRTVPITEATELKLEDIRLQNELANYLSVVAGGQRRDLRTLRINPGSARELNVGYVIEAPVWKTSYRLVLDSHKPGEALLQGWAIVDNPSNEDWRDVDLSLVSGLPISFTQNLYQPHYMTRPEVALPFELALAPRIYEGGLAGVKDEPRARLDYRQMANNMAKASRVQGAQSSLERDEEAKQKAFASSPSVQRAVADAFAETVSAITAGRDLGELFEYHVDKRIDIPRNQSAMIPFVQTDVKAERILLFDPASGRQSPFDALLLTNSSHVTLDGGAITVLEGDRYVGEALIENLRPGDSRPVSFAVDLATRATTAFDSKQDLVTSVKVRRGIITTNAKNVEIKTYTVRNTTDKPKIMIVQHPVRPGWKLAAGGPKPEETTAQNYRFRMTLPPNEAVKLAVSEEMEISNTIALSNLNSDLISNFSRNKALTPETQKMLQSILALKDRISDTQKTVASKQEEINELNRDQERLRQNIYNLRQIAGQEAQVNRYIAKLADQERALEAMQSSLTANRTQARQLQQELDRTMTTLEI